MFVVMPTAIPADPLTSRLGSRPGRTVGSRSRSSKLGTKATVLLSMSSSIVIATRVILAEHFADDGGGFLVRPARNEAELVHGVEDAPVDGLQPVAHIGQRALHDDAHGIVEERLF